MPLRLDDAESAAFGRSVFEIVDETEVTGFQTAVISAASEAVLLTYARIPAEDPVRVKNAMLSGMHFAELQYHTSRTLSRDLQVPLIESWNIQPVINEDDLRSVTDIACRGLTQDRVTRDPFLGAAWARLRYTHFLRRSVSQPNERVYAVRDRSGEILAMRSALVQGDHAKLLLGAVDPAVQGSGAGVVATALFLNALRAEGVRTVSTAIAATNIDIVNLELGFFRFRVTGATVILHAPLRAPATPSV